MNLSSMLISLIVKSRDKIHIIRQNKWEKKKLSKSMLPNLLVKSFVEEARYSRTFTRRISQWIGRIITNGTFESIRIKLYVNCLCMTSLVRTNVCICGFHTYI